MAEALGYIYRYFYDRGDMRCLRYGSAERQ